MKRDELLTRLKSERRRWMEPVDRLDSRQMELPGVAGDWSMKDLLAHIMACEEGLVRWLEAAAQGEALVFADLDHPDLDHRNELIRERYQSHTVTEILREAQRVFDALLAEVEELPDEMLTDVEGTAWFVIPRWKAKRPVWECVADDSYRHYHQHLEDIHTFVRRLEDQYGGALPTETRYVG